MRESDLDLAFSEYLVKSEAFRRWVLEKTGFADSVDDARLLHDELVAARPAVDPRFWYRHWWCRLPDGTESETDIFAVFERASNAERFALHIENKPPNGRFTLHQSTQYARRAEFMASHRRINYSKWQTVLLAPNDFWTVNRESCGAFDHWIAYEDIALYVPQFREALREAGITSA